MKPAEVSGRPLRAVLAPLCIAASLAAAPVPASHAQTPNPSFALIGHIESMSLDDPGNPDSAGKVRVKGIEVVLPQYLLITLPGQFMTLTDLFRGPHPQGASPTARSGLALGDSPPPAVPFEIELIGNIVDGRYIAAVAKLSQMDLGIGAGFIRGIDVGKGEMLVGARREAGETAAQTGARDAAAARVRLNDPAGVHGKPNAGKFGNDADPIDERFALDPENPAVVAATGFPMCLPRDANDANCPAGNRAPGVNRTRFTCGPTRAEPSSPPHAGCDPARQAPLLVGDYITYAGTLVPEPGVPGRFFVAAHAVNAEVGIYTSPGVDPAYVFIEMSLMGMLGEPFPNIDQEETSRVRTVGFTTDPSRNVDVFLVDVDAAGNATERQLTTLLPQRAGQIGRVRITLPSKSNFLAVTREMRYRIAGQPRGSGEYTAPIGEYIYPEATRFGQPSAPFALPVATENFCVLANGPKRLDPFPESGHPVAQPRADGSPTCE
ncbi:MAG: hypothetical protein QM766_28000 [Burkholderiaceae bacterium]